MLCLLLYLLTVSANVFLMVVIYVKPNLHKPMYIFLFHLAVNGVIGSSAFYPKVMDHLLSAVQESSYVGCLFQVFCITTYGACTFTVLAVMAYDRYISICKPLWYHSIITPSKVKFLLTGAYLFPVLGVVMHIILTRTLPLCQFKIHKLFCDNWAVVKLSCVNTNINNIYGIFLTIVFVFFPFIFVIYSYVRILAVCLSISKEAQRKALRTCTPHLITFLNFSLSALFSIIYNRFEFNLPTSVNIVMSIHFIVIPPLLHPVIYGVRSQDIWNCILKILSKKALADKPRKAFDKTSLAVVTQD
ncbi:olfactory receptor 52L1-like [Amia ocellicauda]|uniref:olfactory receptor 52L1-like n=1 Tax=Amia ocellicauda TaxID=2972642 RepID=UPI0034649B66